MKNIICPKLGIFKRQKSISVTVLVEPMWKKEIRKVTPCPQREDSLNAQLRDLIIIAKKFGFYDASDFLENTTHLKLKPRKRKDHMIEYKGYTIAESNGRGGKAGRGHNKTKTLQVRENLGSDNGYLIKKQVTFKVGDSESYMKADAKCKEFIDNLISSD